MWRKVARPQGQMGGIDRPLAGMSGLCPGRGSTASIAIKVVIGWCDRGMSTRPGGQRASNSAPAKHGGGILRLLFGVARAGLGRLRRLTVLDPAFVAQITTFLRFTLAFGRIAVFVHLFLDEPCTFLDLTLD